MNVQEISVDIIEPNPDNINEMGEQELAHLVESIREVGFIAPIQVVPVGDGKYMIVGGEHRWKAAKSIGMATVPAVILSDGFWSDKDVLDLASFKLNNIHGSQDPIKFAKLYERLALKYGAESLQKVFAVSNKAIWSKLTKSISSQMKRAGMPDEIVKQVEATKSVKSLDHFAKKIGKIFSEYEQSGAYGSVVFTHGKNKTIVVKADEKLFSLMEFLNAYSVENKKDFCEMLTPHVANLVADLSPEISDVIDENSPLYES